MLTKVVQIVAAAHRDL